MAKKFFSRRNVDFLLYEVFDATDLTRFPLYRDHNRKVFDMVLDAVQSLARKLLYPAVTEMDQHPPEFVDGAVQVHPVVRQVMAACGEGGWISAPFPVEQGGDQLPEMVSGASRFILAAANYSASVFPFLSAGAAHLITSFGTQDLIDTYVPPMFEGRWQGTMALTEPQAGSSLTDITTEAVAGDDGAYRLQGRKIFISAGDHDAVDNVVHLMLARIPGSPPGVRGISLFVVPKYRPGENGQLAFNDITVSQIYHKLGYRGAPITELSIGDRGDCHGYLVGEPCEGLKYMFQMMNEARLDVGLGAAAIASAAYYAALDYCRQREQGRTPGEKDPSLPPLPIIAHADIRRMLLFQRSVVDGSLSLLLQCSLYADLAKAADEPDRKRYALLLDLLTPIAKTFPSEMGILATSQSIQCFGGYGYCEDFPVQQYFRDIRIHAIHEGTTGIQGMDLLGRKVIMENGQAMGLLAEEISRAVAQAESIDVLQGPAAALGAALEALGRVTHHLIGIAQEHGPEAFLADATLYLELFGLVAVSWQWLRQGITAADALAAGATAGDADFYQGKLLTCQYFFQYELPRTRGLVQHLTEDSPVTLQVDSAHFAD